MPKKILLIEDDSVLSKMYTQKLTSEGYEVLAASDGEMGLDLAKVNKPDLIITDIMLPKISGVEFIAKYLKEKKNKSIPIIAWSNLAQESEKNKALELGAKEYLVKGNVSLDEIAGLVKKYIQ